MLVGAGRAADYESGWKLAEGALKDGSAFEKFCEFIEAQGGDASFARDPEKFPRAAAALEVRAEQDGFIRSMQTEEIGMASLLLGAGRETKESRIDLTAGIRMCVKLGDCVSKGDVLAVLFAGDESKAAAARARLLPAIEIGEKPENRNGHVLKIIR